MPIGGSKPAKGEAVQKGMDGFGVLDVVVQTRNNGKKESVLPKKRTTIRRQNLEKIIIHDKEAEENAWRWTDQ